MPEWLITVLFILAFGTAASGEPLPDPVPDPGSDGGSESPTSFTREFTVPEDDYLFIHGHRIRGGVECWWTSGGPLMINEYQVLPPPNPGILPFSEAELERIYEGKPLVRELVDSGYSWRAAALEWENQIGEVEWEIIDAYHKELDRGGSISAARAAALNAISAATHLISEERPPRWVENKLEFLWEGSRFPIYMHESSIRNTSPGGEHQPMGPSYSKASRLVATIRDVVQARGPSLFVLSSSGNPTSRARGTMSEKEFRETVLSQIAQSTREAIVPGFLGTEEVREIVERGGLDQ